MATQTDMEKFYRETPPDKVPWNKTQDNFLQNLLQGGKLRGKTALDLGCGMGSRSILLAKNGFDVTGVDIAPTAIKLAKEKATKEGVSINFIAADVTDLSFLGDKNYDLIIDLGTMHSIEPKKRAQYIEEMSKHSAKGASLVLRCYSKKDISKIQIGFITEFADHYYFSKEDIRELYEKYFSIKEFRQIASPKMPDGDPPGKWMDEYLMKRK